MVHRWLKISCFVNLIYGKLVWKTMDAAVKGN